MRLPQIPAALALAAALALGAAPAQAAAPLGYTYSTPSDDKGGRRCSGEDQAACKLDQGLVRLTRGTPCSGRIDAVVYSVTFRPLREALLERARCGVKVRLVTSRQKPDGEGEGVDPSGEMRALIDGLRALHQPVKVCSGACSRGGSAGIMHLKLLAFSSTGGTADVVASDSGNMTYQTDVSYNDRLTWADRKSYAGVVRWVGLLSKDRKVKGESGVLKSSDGRRTIYLHPVYSRSVPQLVLAQARGRKGCLIQVAPFYYAGGDAKAETTLLLKRHREGARVQVASNDLTGHWSATERRRLVKGGVEVFDVAEWVDQRRELKVYSHRKTLTVSGCSRVKDTLVQGSTTTNKTARAYNDNADVLSTVPSDVASARAGFSAMVRQGTRL